MRLKPIGLFGGTFDPVHYGHLQPAKELADAIDVGELRLLPCRVPVLKGLPRASDELRLEMLAAAVGDYPGFVVDPRELNRSGPSYTVDTLAGLREEYPEAPLCFMVGSDAWQGLTQWHRWQDILGLAHLVVAQRPGVADTHNPVLHDLAEQHAVADPSELHLKSEGSIYFHEVTQLDISSSMIRAKLSQGEDVGSLMPPVVAGIIERSGCYQTREAT